MQSWLNGGKRSHDLKSRENWEFHSESSGIYGGSGYEGKSVGLTPMNLSKTTIARFFRVHEDGLHLKIVKNGKCENVWPLSNGKFLWPTGTKNAHVVAFPAEDQDLQEDDDDDFQGTFGGRYVRTFFCVCDYFFLQCFISLLYKEGNILKARFDHLR